MDLPDPNLKAIRPQELLFLCHCYYTIFAPLMHEEFRIFFMEITIPKYA